MHIIPRNSQQQQQQQLFHSWGLQTSTT